MAEPEQKIAFMTFMAFMPQANDFPKQSQEKLDDVYVIRPRRTGQARGRAAQNFLMVCFRALENAHTTFPDVPDVLDMRFMVTEPKDLKGFVRDLKLARERMLLEKNVEHLLVESRRHLLTALIDDSLMPLDPSSVGVADLARRGLPTDVADLVVNSGTLTRDELYALVIPERTLRDRKRQEKPLTNEESDRLLRVIRVIERATEVFESRQKALRWLRKSKRRLQSRKPIDLLDTDASVTEIMNWLDRIDYGIAA